MPRLARSLTILMLSVLAVLPSCHGSHRPMPQSTGVMETPDQSESRVTATISRPEPTVLAKGAPIHGANGIRFDSQDRLHIASVLGNEIMVIDPETGDVISTIGTNQNVVGPDDICFGPDGSLYWTSFSTGEVGRISSDGARSGQFLRPGVNGIAFSDRGRLFVTLIFMGDALFEIDPDLVAPPRLVAEKMGFVNGIDWGPDGFLYGPVWTKGQVVRINVDTGEITLVADGFKIPSAVKFDSKGHLYVVEQVTGQVLRVDTKTGTKEVVTRVTPGLDNLAFDSSGRLFVSHGQDGCIFEILSDGTARTVCPGGMIAPGGIAVVPGPNGESVFVADFWTLREFDAASGREKSCRRHCIGVRGGITSPFTVSADGRNLLLSSWLPKDVVQVFDPERGEVLEEYAGFDEPLNAIRFQGDIVVAEHGSKSVVRISSREPEKRVTLAKGLGVPVGLAATDGDLWVSDWAAGTVLQIVADGKVLAEPRPIATNLAYPEGLAVDKDGNLLVVETEAGRLSRIDAKTHRVSTVAENLAPCLLGDHPTWIFNGVAVSPSGTIYLASDVANLVYRIEPRP